MLLAQSSLPVHMMTCSAYGAIVFSSGVLRSMSRSAGAEAHSHVGAGHVGVYGIVACLRDAVRENWRMLRIQGARAQVNRGSIKDILVWGRSAWVSGDDLYTCHLVVMTLIDMPDIAELGFGDGMRMPSIDSNSLSVRAFIYRVHIRYNWFIAGYLVKYQWLR
jgi:hypothetical protein